jgi:hypothetical protein
VGYRIGGARARGLRGDHRDRLSVGLHR